MSLPYRTFTREVGYICPLCEAAILARTTQRTLGLSKALATRGISYVVSMYHAYPPTPFADAILTSIAWYPALDAVPRQMHTVSHSA